MTEEPCWIPIGTEGKLAIMARPRGGEGLALALRALADRGVTGLVSLLSLNEQESLDLGHEAAACSSQGLSFRSLPIEDFGVPLDETAFSALALVLSGELRNGAVLVLHCHAGIGRSSLLAAAVLTLSGLEPQEALDEISAARGRAVPDTEEQRLWFLDSARSSRDGLDADAILR